MYVGEAPAIEDGVSEEQERLQSCLGTDTNKAGEKEGGMKITRTKESKAPNDWLCRKLSRLVCFAPVPRRIQSNASARFFCLLVSFALLFGNKC